MPSSKDVCAGSAHSLRPAKDVEIVLLKNLFVEK
jgi:hypothetical protein